MNNNNIAQPVKIDNCNAFANALAKALTPILEDILTRSGIYKRANKPLMNASELEAELGLRTGTVKQLAAQGLIPAHHIKGRKNPLYNRHDVYSALHTDDPYWNPDKSESEKLTVEDAWEYLICHAKNEEQKKQLIYQKRLAQA